MSSSGLLEAVDNYDELMSTLIIDLYRIYNLHTGQPKQNANLFG